MELKRIGMDTSKHVFSLHGVDAAGQVVLRRDLRRGQVEAFFAGLAPCEVVMEACGGSHHWARRLGALGHQVRLIPAQYVKPFVKRGKNDRADAAAICTAAGQPDMPGVPVKSAAQQAALMLLKTRELLVRQRTQLVNALRGHAAEFGIVAARGTAQIEALLAAIAADPDIPPPALEALGLLSARIAQVSEQVGALDAALLAQHRANPMSRLLEGIPGVGPITALSLALTVEPGHFASGRHFAAWIGLTPRQNSTGGKTRLGRISKAGHRRLRSLLIVGATTVIQHVRPGRKATPPWLLDLVARKPRKLAAVALANKMARTAWAMMARGEAYRRTPVPA